MYRDAPVAQSCRRSDQEFLQFARPLLVAPIPYPHHVRIFLGLQRTEMRRVGGLLKGPDILYCEGLAVNFANRFPECQHTVKLLQRKSQNSCGLVYAR